MVVFSVEVVVVVVTSLPRSSSVLTMEALL
ncbi:MAG: hypothetical protein ACI8RD_002997 [Bacillariaceae sp.]